MLAVLALLLPTAGLLVGKGHSWQFDIVGDRTGEARPGVYPQIWNDVVADHPAFAVSVGDSIQGYDDSTINEEWAEVMNLLRPYRRFDIFFTPGNHDVWNQQSSEAYVKYTKRPLHYGFDYEQAHFTILNDSMSDSLSADELGFLRDDLRQHRDQPVKFIVSHRPSWILHAAFNNPDFELQRIATEFGVHYVIAGHVHQMLRFRVADVLYLSVPSAGGHLRDSKEYADGWFFGHTTVTVSGDRASFEIKETGEPFGKGRITVPEQWGAAGLVQR